MKIRGITRFVINRIVLIPLLLVGHIAFGNTCESGCNDYRKALSGYLIAAGESFCVSKLYELCFEEDKMQCVGELSKYQRKCLNLSEPLSPSSNAQFDPNLPLKKYLSCIADNQLLLKSESKRESYKNCLGPSFY